MEIAVPQIINQKIVTAGAAYWNQRNALASLRGRLTDLFHAVDHPGDLFLSQWAQLTATTLEFEPDVILELGRGRGNSTCAFTEALNRLGGSRKLISLCQSDDWDRLTQPRVSKVVPPSWFHPLKTLKEDILHYPYETVLNRDAKYLVFWDAHGFDVAECVLGKILPLIANRPHLVIMHDLSDARYSGPEAGYYGANRLWRGNDWSGPRLRLGHIDSSVEQAVAAVDFTSRNQIRLNSADESLHLFFGSDSKKQTSMKDLVGEEMFSLAAHWFYFSLNERSGVFTFPRFESPDEKKTSSCAITPKERPAGMKSRIKSWLQKSLRL